MNRPPLKDVARRAGVSEPTVSRVLNGRPGVATETRERVVGALEAMGFTAIPDPGPTRSGTIGVVCGELDNPVFPTLVHHTTMSLARRGMLVNVAVLDDRLSPEDRCVAEFRRNGVDGVIFIAGHHAAIDGSLDGYEQLIDEQTPIVLVNGRETDLPVPHIWCDEGSAAGRAVRHLADLGHRRIGCLVGSDRYVPTLRIRAGYAMAMTDAGLTPERTAVATTAFTFEGARAAARRLLSRGITGIFAANDLMALGAIDAGRSIGFTTPGDMSVVGYDGTDLTAFTQPPLTTMRQPFEDMAELIADSVVAQLDGSTALNGHYPFEAELLARASTGPAPAVPDRALAGPGTANA